MKRILLAAVLALPLVAHAGEDLSYSYLGFGATYIDPEGFSGQNGFGAEASGAITENWHVVGGYTATNLDDVDADVDSWHVGLGYNMGINDTLDFVGRVSYVRTDVSAATFSDDNDGFGVRAGVRNAFTSNFEGSVGLNYENYSGSDDVGLYANAQFKFGDWGIVAEATAYEDGTILYVGPRLSF